MQTPLDSQIGAVGTGATDVKKKTSADPLGDAGLTVPGAGTSATPIPPPASSITTANIQPPSMVPSTPTNVAQIGQTGQLPSPSSLTPPPTTAPPAPPPPRVEDPYTPSSTATEGTWDEISGSYKNPDGSTLSGPTAVGNAPTKPLLGGDTHLLNQYWGSQGEQVAGSSLGLTPIGYDDNGVAKYDPKEMATAQAGLSKNVDPRVTALLGSLKTGAANDDTSALKENVGDFNAQTVGDDTARDAASNAFIPGYTTPENMAYAAMHGGASPPSTGSVSPVSPAPVSPVSPAAGGGSPAGSATAPTSPPRPIPVATSPATTPATATATTAAPPRTREQQAADLVSSYVMPGRQTTANNDDPLSGVTSIDPANDLRSSVITDTPDARTANYADRVDQAASALPTDRVARANSLTDSTLARLGDTDVKAGPGVAPAASDRLSKLQSLVDSATGNLAGVDRVALAKQMFDTLSAEGNPAYELAQRQAAKRASAAGGLWGGNLRTQYGDLAHTRMQELDSLKAKLVQQALNDSVQDQFNKTNMLSGIAGQLSGEEAAQRGEQRQERDYTTNVDTGNVDRRLNTRQAAQSRGDQVADASIGDERANLGTLKSLEDSSRSANTNAVNALRGERGYQVGQDENAFERALLQRQTQQGEKQQGFDNSLRLLNAGETGNPGGTLGAIASEMGPSLDPSMIAQLAASMGKSGAAPPAGSTGGTAGNTGSDIANFFAGLSADQRAKILSSLTPAMPAFK
jgi:hypothetical protein